MGYSGYSTENRLFRSTSDGYNTKQINEIFTQNVERKMHKDMDPKWKALLGQNLIEITDHITVSRVISDIILSYSSQEVKSSGIRPAQESVSVPEVVTEENLL